MSQNENNNETETNDWHLKFKEIAAITLNSVNLKAFYKPLSQLEKAFLTFARKNIE